jgi:hypothetical protein
MTSRPRQAPTRRKGRDLGAHPYLCVSLCHSLGAVAVRPCRRRRLDDLPSAVKKSFDAMVEAEAAFKADLERLLKQFEVPVPCSVENTARSFGFELQGRRS